VAHLVQDGLEHLVVQITENISYDAADVFEPRRFGIAPQTSVSLSAVSFRLPEGFHGSSSPINTQGQPCDSLQKRACIEVRNVLIVIIMIYWPGQVKVLCGGFAGAWPVTVTDSPNQ
jgi:hypothetical protein